jgi:hypothetical protein
MANKPGPMRNPNSRRGQAEIRKKQRLALVSAAVKQDPSSAVSAVPDCPHKLPTCPKWLPKRVVEKWLNLVIDMAAAGIVVQAIDSRSIALAAGYEADLSDLEDMASGEISHEHLMQTIRLKNSCRKDLLAALMAIGGTPVVRLRARIAPEEKAKPNDDPWSQI